MSAFYFLRDESFDARGYFEDPNSAKAPFHFQQFGGTLGGPIRKNKTFFFMDYQGTRRRSADTGIYSVPTAAQRHGDFSGEGNSIIYDPLTGQPFPGNVIPADRFDPLAQNFVNLYPNPNQDGLKNNYLVNPSSTNTINQGDVRLDHQFSPDNRVFLRLSLSKGNRFLEPPLPGLANGGDYGTGTSDSKTWGAALGFTHVFSSTTVNELRVGFNRVKGSDGITAGGQQAPPPELTVPGVANDPAVAGITVFDPAGYSHVGDPEFIPTYTLTQELQLSDTLSLVRGRHSMKTGFQLRRSYFDLFQIPQPRGKFSFSGEFTQDPDHNDGTGDPLADALLGYSSQIDISNITQTRNRTPVFGAFFQDDFKVTPSLTLNLGLRWDYTGPTVEADDRQSNFDYATGQVLVANQNGNSRGLIDVDKFDFAPRIGFAWTPFKDGKTAFRGGYGIFYGAQEVRTGFQLGYSMPFFFALSKSSEFGVTPAAYVNQGFPALDPAAASFPGLLSADQRFKSPYYQQWNVSVQRDVGWNTSLEVAYVGSKGTHLQVLRDYNQPQPGPGDPQERRPYPQYGNFGSITNAGSSTYNSIQMKLNKRWSDGLWLLTAFTYSKAYNDQPEICCASPWPPDSYNIHGEHGPADYDQRYRSVTSFAWDLPFGEGRHFLDTDGVLNGIFGGWQFGGIVTITAGFPFSPAISLDTSNTGTFGQLRPDLIGDPNAANPSPARWYNPEAYATPAEFTFGNAGRNSLVGPGTRTADFYMQEGVQDRGSRAPGVPGRGLQRLQPSQLRFARQLRGRWRVGRDHYLHVALATADTDRRAARVLVSRARDAWSLSPRAAGRLNGQEVASQTGRHGSRDRRRPPRLGLRPGSQLGRLRLGHRAAGQRPPLPGAVSAVSARGSAPRVRGRDGHDTLARGRARLRNGSRHLRHGRLRRQHLPGRGHGEGDRGLRAGAVGPETLRPAHLARAAEAPGPPGSGRVLEDDPRDGEAVRQAGRLPRPDERSRHRGAGPARFRPRQGADGSSARRRVEARSSSENRSWSHATTIPSSRTPSAS